MDLIKVLFVSSGNSKNGISSIIKNQGESLNCKVEVTYFTIKKKGFFGYLSTIPKLYRHLRSNEYDIIHAHYSLSAYVASLALAKPLVVSLMGSDVNAKGLNGYVIRFFHFFFWDKTIVKSLQMKETLNLKNIAVIPNGVDFDKFKPIDRDLAIEKVNWNKNKKHILFAANPKRAEKNYQLAKEGFHLLNNPNVELHYLQNIANIDMPFYFNASNVVILTSLWEGSPNVIKEAMACNVPIVSTDVGDVRSVIRNTKGCFISDNNPKDISIKLLKALSFNSKTDGRNHIGNLNIERIADKIVQLYKEVLTHKNNKL